MKHYPKPTDGELEILNVLWQSGPGTVRTVHEELTKKKDAGYTTTLKLMQIMHDKGLLERNTDSRTHVYTAKAKQEEVQGDMLQKMVDTIFNGSTAALVMQALGNKKANKAELEKIRQYLREMENKEK